jgi:alpha-ketoglutarate-dependent taurine dioxygenase
MEQEQSRGPSGPGFKAIPRRSVRVAEDDLIRTGFLPELPGLPLLVEPAAGGGELIGWAEAQRSWIDRQLDAHGALLFRGFSLAAAEDFERFVGAATGGSLEYTERSSPRSQVSGKIYTSTDYPPEMPIFLHNEQSYNRTFPLRILFFCLIPAEQGGATPIADVRKVYRRLDSEVRRRFAREGYLYVRNFGDGFGLSWQEAFGTGNRAAVESYCRDNGIAFEWKENGRLRTCQHRRAVGLHPRTGEPVWFNHLTFFHVSTLEPQVQEALRRELADEDLPNNTYHADGSPIELDVMEHLRAAYRAETLSFPWRRGDVLMLDNMLTAHARESFTGPRKIVVAMAQPVGWDAVAPAVGE